MMKSTPIFCSLLDDDKYKFSMQQANFHNYPGAEGRYKFKCRTPDVDLTVLIPALREQAEMIGDLRFTQSEIAYLRQEKHLTDDYIEYLKDFRLDPSQLRIEQVDGELEIEAEGSLLKASRWEIYVLAMINELFFRSLGEPDYQEGRRRLMKKIKFLKNAGEMPGFGFADFGTRRRFSLEWHKEVINTLQHEVPEYFIGTSNYYMAREFGITPIGTMAHEYLQTFQGLVHPLDASKTALNEWANEFRGDLGIALTDVISMKAFCKELDLFLAKQFDGFRQDSGDGSAWGNQLINRLNELGVDPTTKTGVWSDSLNMEKSVALYREFHGKLKTSFGIGTNLTNDLGRRPINVVMKLVEVNGRPVAKLSDSPGKTMCEDEAYVNWLKSSYGK